MFDPRSLKTTATVAGLVALGPLSTDMYLPAFPQLARVFDARMGAVQQTLSIFLVGFALGQLLYGPLSDRLGRRPALLGGLLLFLVGSIGSSRAGSIEMLTLMRLLQALGASAGPVLGRAMIRDIYGPVDAARLLSYIATAMAVAPAVAPILGGYLTTWLGWQSIFLSLALYAAVCMLLMGLYVPETLPPFHQPPASFRRLLGNYDRLLRDPAWRWYTLSCSFVFAGLFSFLSGSPFVIIDFYGYSEERYGLFFTLIVIGYMTGTQIAGRGVKRLGIDRLLGAGALTAAAGGVTMALLALLQVHSVWAVILPHMLFMAGTGIVMPQAMAGAMASYPEMAGTSSALLGFFQMALAALTGTLVGQFHDGTPLSMSLTIGAMGLLTLGCALALGRYRTNRTTG
ncbi:MAG TPA: Bcr/CflA family multidrug efflux MFS transporter [Sedimenticola sp.]|nr:Bcr/CflA family multidrug efflux MFS transporter [Sedimenticola sp.]